MPKTPTDKPWLEEMPLRCIVPLSPGHTVEDPDVRDRLWETAILQIVMSPPDRTWNPSPRVEFSRPGRQELVGILPAALLNDEELSYGMLELTFRRPKKKEDQ